MATPVRVRPPLVHSTAPGILVEAENEENEYKSLTKLHPGGSGPVTADIICKSIGKWKNHFNAFLNSRAGGTIHFGIGDDCRVEEGVCLTEKDQDEIKRRIGHLFGEFCPVCRSEYYTVNFVKLDNECHRFDVDIKHSNRVTRFMGSKQTEAYIRSGPSSVKLTVEEIKARLRSEEHTVADERPDLLKLLNFPGKSGNISIPKRISRECFLFGVLLLNDKTGAEVSAIVKTCRDDAEQINQEILRRWIGGKGKPLSWDTLIDVLKAVELNTLADDIQDGLQNQF